MDVMLDIECLGVAPDAVILTVAAIGFDPCGAELYPQHAVYHRVDTDSQPDRGIDPATVAWWANQCEAAKAEAFGEQDRVPLRQAMEQLAALLWKASRIWANGVTYDMTILEHAYKGLGMPLPWKYYRVMDARTVYKLCPAEQRLSNNHHALQDCINQAELLQRCFRRLNIRTLNT